MLIASGELERLAASPARHCDRAIILSDMAAGHIACTRIGGPLLFGRLWERLGIAAVLEKVLHGRGFELRGLCQRPAPLFVSGSDRSCNKWMADHQIAGLTNWCCMISIEQWLGAARRRHPPGRAAWPRAVSRT
jgi:hypothetical protein